MKQFYTSLCFIVFFAPTLVMAQSSAIKRASLSTAPVTSVSEHYTVQQSIGHAGIMSTKFHGDNAVLRGFLLPQLNPVSANANVNVSWVVYPVPFYTYFNIDFDFAVSGDMTVRLHDVTGQLVIEKTLEAKQQQRIHTGHLAQGEYVLSVEVMNKQFSKQIMNHNYNQE